MSCVQICFIQLQRSNLGARCNSCTCKQALGKVRHEFSRSVRWEQFYDPLKRGGNHAPPALKFKKFCIFPTYWLRAERSGFPILVTARHLLFSKPAVEPTFRFFPGCKAAGAWCWLQTSIQCHGLELVELCLYYLIRIHGFDRGSFTFFIYCIYVLLQLSHWTELISLTLWLWNWTFK